MASAPPSPPSPPSKAPTLSFLAFVLLVVGSCQVYAGVGRLDTRGYLPMPVEDSPEAAESLRNISRIVEDDPHRGALAIAAIIAGALLAFAAIRLLRRRDNALWWTRQALVANLLVTAGTMVRHATHLLGKSSELIPEVRAYASAMPDGPESGQVMDMIWLQAMVSDGSFAAFLLYLLWRVTRPEAREQLRRSRD